MPSQILSRRDRGHRFLSGLLRHLRLALALRRERRRLALLDDHLLRDIGISRDAARREAARRDWDVPDHWRR